MKYSVLMTSYINDNPDFLKIALESIYEKQTRKPDEIVVVFDGPLNDELYKMFDDFRCGKEDFVFYYPQSCNKGRGTALKIGSEKCTGDYIFIMDSDDISVAERFEKQIEYLETNPQIDVLGGNIAEFKKSLDEKMRLRICPKSHNEIVKMITKRNPVNQVTVCIKRSALEKCGGYEELVFAEEYYLWLKMVVSGCKIENMQETLVYVRVGNGFEIRRSSKQQISIWIKIQKYMMKHGMINMLNAFINMVCIVGFTYCPVSLKKIVYDKLLRKGNETK